MKKILSSVVAAGLIASVAFGEKVKLYTHDFYKNPNYEGTHQCYKFIDKNVNANLLTNIILLSSQKLANND